MELAPVLPHALVVPVGAEDDGVVGEENARRRTGAAAAHRGPFDLVTPGLAGLVVLAVLVVLGLGMRKAPHRGCGAFGSRVVEGRPVAWQ
ncbi:hypothetical protein ACH4YN_33420 [Streptomyces griseofuscus]|uniref:hypothetical protein n=1 Tax=Streptomyces griseofuscus TaxID=146922 RepID=UPI0037AE371C